MRVYAAIGPTDMRKSFTGLVAAVQQVIGKDPLSGHLFAFCNRRRNLLKVLVWDGSGFWVLAKRLERGTFAWPASSTKEPHVVLGQDELSCILGGLDIGETSRRFWWRREPTLDAS